jgi:DNA-binding MarR family transcriptional regulator
MSSRNNKTLVPSLRHAVRLFIAGASFLSQRAADTLGLHPTDMQFVNLLDLLGPMTPGALAQWSGLTSGGVTVVLDRLESAGYVRREPNPDDRRSVLIHLRPVQQKRLDANYKGAQKQFARVTRGFSEPELEVILRFFTASSAGRAPLPQSFPKKK